MLFFSRLWQVEKFEKIRADLTLSFNKMIRDEWFSFKLYTNITWRILHQKQLLKVLKHLLRTFNVWRKQLSEIFFRYSRLETNCAITKYRILRTIVGYETRRIWQGPRFYLKSLPFLWASNERQWHRMPRVVSPG